mgnify:CR=1 FL=1
MVTRFGSVATAELTRALMKLFSENRRPEVTRLLHQITALDEDGLARLRGISYGVTAPDDLRAEATRIVADLGGFPEWIALALNFIVSFAVITLLFALMFKYIPDAEIEWRDVLLGALFTSVLFAIGRFLIGLYLGKASFGSTYGAAGSLVIVLVWAASMTRRVSSWACSA